MWNSSEHHKLLTIQNWRILYNYEKRAPLCFGRWILICLPLIAPSTWGKFHVSWTSQAIFSDSSVDKGRCKYSPARASNIASQVSPIMRLRAHFPMRYVNDNNCCDSLNARKRKVTASLSPADIAFRKFVSSFVILFSSNPSKWSNLSGDIWMYL